MIVVLLLFNFALLENIETFYKNFKKASYEDYTIYAEVFKSAGINNITITSVTEFYYKNVNPEGYIVSFPNQDYFRIFIYIDPCKNFEQYCCQGMGDCREDNTVIVAGQDLEIAWSANNYLPICDNEFTCGTFIEIHMPGNPEVIEEHKVSEYTVNGYQTVFLNTYRLCSGRYEIWFVFRMRDYKYINYVKPMYVRYPSCTCETIRNNNFNCI